MSHSASKPKKAYALILTITLLVSGCSGFGFLFERLDWLMVWQLDRMFDLSSEQEEQIQPKAAELREWLRNEGFPKIIDGFNQTLTLWNADKLEAALDHMDKTTKALTSTFLAQ